MNFVRLGEPVLDGDAEAHVAAEDEACLGVYGGPADESTQDNWHGEPLGGKPDPGPGRVVGRGDDEQGYNHRDGDARRMPGGGEYTELAGVPPPQVLDQLLRPYPGTLLDSQTDGYALLRVASRVVTHGSSALV